MLVSECLSILGIDASASTAELKAAYRSEIRKWHPDRFHDDAANQPTALERSKEINSAYEHLSELHESGALPESMPRSSRQGAPTPPPKAYRAKHTYNGKAFTPGFPDPSVLEVFLKSSHIISTGYSRRTNTLYIKFDGDVVYGYLLVPASVFANFISAESFGRFAHKNIYSRFQSVRH